MIRSFVLAFALLLPSFAYSQPFIPPSQNIVGADKPVDAGEMVVLSLSQAAPTKSLVSIKVDWLVFEPLFDDKTKEFKGYKEKAYLYSKDDKVFFGAGLSTKKLLVVASVNYVFEEKGADGKVTKFGSVTMFLNTTVNIVGKDCKPEPTPTPTPDPDPTPTPDPEDKVEDKFGLIKLSSEEGGKLSVAAKRLAPALSQSFNRIATQIAAGAFGDYKAIFAATKEANNKVLGENVKDFEKWKKVIEDKLFKLAEAGELESNESYAQAWRELSAGLLKVK